MNRFRLVAADVSRLKFLRLSMSRLMSAATRFMESPLPIFRMHWDHEPIRFGPRAVPARSGHARTRVSVIFPPCRRGPHAATGDRSRSATSPQPTHGQRFMGSPLSFFRMHWDHEPDNAVGARLCEPQRVATAPSPAGHRRALRDGRFMESPDAIFSAHWDDEPVLCKSLLCSPTVFRFMGSLRNCSHMSDAKLHRTRPCPRLLDASGEGDRRRGAGWFMNRGDGDETV